MNLCNVLSTLCKKEYDFQDSSDRREGMLCQNVRTFVE